jgi:signal transduction histidine kinase
MRASLDVAMAKPEPPPVQTVLLADRLRTELDRIDELLAGFLVLARAQHGALPDLAVVSRGDLASAALAVRASAIAARELTVQAEVSPAGPCVAGSQALVSRMVDNVIDNAIVHNERAGWLRVAVGPVEPGTVAASTVAATPVAATPVAATTGGRWACVVVENDGPVLDQAQVAQLAQPFRRLGASGHSTGRIATGGGSGLGLSIVAAIAAAHGGTLELSARPEGGLRVAVSLPLAAAAALTGAPA